MSKERFLQLENTISQLISTVNSFEREVKKFKAITNEFISAINVQNIQALNFYLSDWFSRMLYFKDDHMVLMTGQIFQSRHEQLYKQYFHSRSSEARYYKAKLLSFFSVDGIDYEYREISNKLSSKYMERLDLLASNSENLSIQLKSMEKIIDGTCATMENFLRSLSFGVPTSVNIVRKHLEEAISILASKEYVASANTVSMSTFTPIFITRRTVKQLSAAEAFSTTVAESTGATSAPRLNESVKRNRNGGSRIIDDDDDEVELVSASRTDSFLSDMNAQSSMQFSVNALKKAYGINPDSLESNRRFVDQEASVKNALELYDYAETVDTHSNDLDDEVLMVEAEMAQDVDMTEDDAISNKIEFSVLVVYPQWIHNLAENESLPIESKTISFPIERVNTVMLGCGVPCALLLDIIFEESWNIMMDASNIHSNYGSFCIYPNKIVLKVIKNAPAGAGKTEYISKFYERGDIVMLPYLAGFTSISLSCHCKRKNLLLLSSLNLFTRELFRLKIVKKTSSKLIIPALFNSLSSFLREWDDAIAANSSVPSFTLLRTSFGLKINLCGYDLLLECFLGVVKGVFLKACSFPVIVWEDGVLLDQAGLLVIQKYSGV